MSIRYNLDTLTKQINATFIDKNFLQNLYHSMTGITGIIKAIHETQGHKWAAYATYDDGTSLFPETEQQEQFTLAFQPYVPSILEFMSHRTDKKIAGGQQTDGQHTDDDYTDGQQTDDNQTPSAQEDPIGPDDMYTKAVQIIDNINAAAHQFANSYGILYYQREFEKSGDVSIFPEVITQPITMLGPTGAAVGKTLSGIKLPIRTIVFLVYLILDVTRVSLSIAGSESNSRILSVVVALLELLKGDWKQAIVSFVGYYGQTPLLIGQNIKIFLYLYDTLSPHLRENIIYGLPSIPKSILIGVLLAIFKVTAPYSIRTSVKNALERIREKNKEINKILTDEKLEPRADYFSPTFDDLNNLQSLISGDFEYICSCEYEELIKPLRDSSILYIIIQMLDIPISKEFRRVKCGRVDCKPFIDALVEKETPVRVKSNKLNEPGRSEEQSTGQMEEEVPAEQEVPVKAPGAPNTPVEAPVEALVEAPVEAPEANNEPGQSGGKRSGRRILRCSRKK